MRKQKLILKNTADNDRPGRPKYYRSNKYRMLVLLNLTDPRLLPSRRSKNFQAVYGKTW